MVTTGFFLDSRRGAAPYSLKLRMTYKRKTAYLNMNVKLEEDQWDGYRIIRHPRAQMLNNQLAARKADIDTQLYQWHVNGELVGKDVATIKSMLEAEDEGNDFIAYWQKAVARRTEKTQKVYKQALNSITGYDSRPSFGKIDIDWLIGFDRWMTKTMPSANTRSICMRCLRAVMNDALDDEVISYYPFRKFKIKQEPTKKKALSLSQVHTLLHWEVEDYQQRYRDLFILMILMRGINIGDMCLLTQKNVVDGRIEYRRQKTHKDYSIKIEPEIQEIIDRWKGKKYLLNVMDTYAEYDDFKTRMNKALKDIGEVKHLKQGKKEKTPLFPKLSTNWARHTFATIALNECGLPRDMISDLLGHSEGLDVTNIYIKKDLEKMDAAARKVIDKVMYGK